MSTSGPSESLNPISSILLGMTRMPRISPDKILTRLKDPKFLSDDYHYLDALATLCTFAGVAPCDSVAAAVEYGTQCNRLYLAARPSAPSSLRRLVPAWIDLMQNMSRHAPHDTIPSSSSRSSELEGDKPWNREHTVLQQGFIVEIYHACHAALLDAVNRPGYVDIAEDVFEFISDMDPAALRFYKISGSPLKEELNFLVRLAKKWGSAAASLSAKDLLNLHRAAGTVAWFQDVLAICGSARVYEAADRLSHAVDALIKFASSARYREKVDRPWTVIWVDVPNSTSAFVATTDAQELAAIVTDEESLRDELVSIFRKWKPFQPPTPSGPRDVRPANGSPNHFTVNRVVHSEVALISYFYKNRDLSRAVEPYLGCSHPICFPCLMFVDACNLGGDMDPIFEVGCRCADLRRLDVGWAYPREMGSEIYWMLLDRVAGGFECLCTQLDYMEYSRLPNDETSAETRH